MVILPFLAVFTMGTLFITLIPNFDSSAVEMVNFFGFVFMIKHGEFLI
jgi:hypothetical protein